MLSMKFVAKIGKKYLITKYIHKNLYLCLFAGTKKAALGGFIYRCCSLFGAPVHSMYAGFSSVTSPVTAST